MSATAADDPRREWVARVLGVSLQTGASGDAAARWQSARAAWETASAAVDVQITALQAALRAIDDDELHQIAETGLNAITGDHRVPVMAAVAEIGAGGAADLARAAPKALAAVRAFQAHLAADPRVKACDSNPFGVAMSVQATLGAALAKMESVFAAAAG